jgi:hypothetical protein
MRTYQASGGPIAAAGGDTRDWVFGVLGNARHRRRLEALAALDIARRPGCEPSLRALVTDDWDHDTLYHVGWCQSCRAAALALGVTTASGAARSPHRRHALYVVLAAAVAIAAPLAASDLLSRDGGHSAAQSGGSRTTPATTTPGTTSSTPATTPAQTTTTPAVTPLPRAKHPRRHAAPAKRVKRALPLTT